MGKIHALHPIPTCSSYRTLQYKRFSRSGIRYSISNTYSSSAAQYKLYRTKGTVVYFLTPFFFRRKRRISRKSKFEKGFTMYTLETKKSKFINLRAQYMK